MSPTPTPRPAQGFSTDRAQQWVVVSAVLNGVIYGFRKLYEPVSSTPAKGGKVSQLIGAGGPPAPLGTWAVAYGFSYITLAVLAMAAPELAASLAMMILLGNLLSNGITIAADLSGAEHGGVA